MNKISNFKKIVSIGFFAAFLAVFLSAGTAQAGFWDWFNIGGDSQQAAVSGSKTYTLRVNKSGYGGNYRNIMSSDKKINCGFDCSERYLDAQTITLTAISKSNNYSFDRWTGGGCSGSGSCVVEVNKPNGTVSVRAIFKKGPSASRDASETVPSASASLVAKTGNADNITSNSARLKGAINPQGQNVSVYFKYRKESESAEATKTTEWMSTDSRSNDLNADIKVSGLSSGTKYVYQFYAYNYTSGKTIYGDSKYFTTKTSSESSSSSSSSVQSSSSSVSSGASSSSSSVQQYTLKVKISGAGQISGSGIKCKKSTEGKYSKGGNWTCSVKINKGAEVTLYSSEPSTQYEFATWADNCRAFQKSTSCNFEMSGNKTVSATFNKKGAADKETVSVSVKKLGSGVGKVVSINYSGKEISGINCGSNCSENFQKNCVTDIERYGGDSCATVYFRAVAEKGSTFSGWGGDCLTFKNEKDQCYVHLDKAKTITAKFNEGSNNAKGKYYNLKVTAPDNGVIASTDGKINCGSGNIKCDHSYGKNGTVTLKITPNSGYVVSSMSECSSGKTKNSDGSYDCKVKMKKNQSISVIFKVSGTSSSSSSSEASSSSFGPYSTVTGSASNITSTSTTLNGTIIPNGNSLSYIFAYRKNSESSSATKYVPFNSYTSIGSTSGDVSVSADISGLSSGTKYIYRLYVWNSKTKKVTSGLVKYFTTSGGSSSSSSFSSSSNNSSRSSLSSSKHTIKVNIKNASTIEGQLYIRTSKNGSTGCVIKVLNNADCSLSGITHDDTVTIKIENTTGSFSGWSDDSNVCNDNIKTCDIKMDADKTISITFGS